MFSSRIATSGCQRADLLERRATVLRRADDLELRALPERAHEAVEVDRVILTDVDGDPRSHGAAAVRYAIGGDGVGSSDPTADRLGSAAGT